MINRLSGVSVPGVAAQQKVFTCSTGDVLSGAAINGRVIDRLGLGRNRIYETAEPFIHAYTTVGSTAADQKVTLSIKLQHGDSSGGGDMADYSTGMQSADAIFRTTAESTAYQNWSTGAQFWGHDSEYNVIAAKRYVRPVGVWTRGGTTTSTAAGSVDYQYVTLGVRFGGPDVADGQSGSLSSTNYSTSTST
jgi:hypothetical protein